MVQSSLLKSALGAAFLASVCATSPAHALEPKQCLSLADMNTALKAEGQRTLIIGNREAVYNPKDGEISHVKFTDYANAVTSNADGSLGYQIEGDLPREQASTTMCVSAKLTNVRLFDARKAGTPKAALLGGAFDEAVLGLEQKGTRPMLVADTFRGDDVSRHGNPLVVFGNVQGRSGSLATMTSTGPQMLALMGDVDYTPEALRRLGAVQVAMREPN